MKYEIPTTEHGTLRKSKTKYDHTYSALLSKRADLIREDEAIQVRQKEIVKEVATLDATLRLIGFEGDLDAVRPQKQIRRVFGAGELVRLCLDTLKASERPLMSRDIAKAIVEHRGEKATTEAVSSMTKRVCRTLLKEREIGTVKSSAFTGRAVVWEYVGMHGE